MKHLARLLPLLALCFAMPASAQPASFPEREVRIVVPYPPGGSVDVTARMLAERLAKRWSKPVIVENRSGAAAVIGTSHVARSRPDGHTLLMATAGMSVQPSVFSNLPYDVHKDFAPVTRLFDSPSLLTVNADVPVKNVTELVAWLKANPHTPFGSQGMGSLAHLQMAIFQSATGVDMLHVPYRGSAPATQALLAGETKLHFDIMTSMLPHVSAGKARPMAVTTPMRQGRLADTPTMQEAGLPSVAVSSWSGIFAPQGTPAALVTQIQQAFSEVLKDPEVAGRLTELGYVLNGSTPEAFDTFFREDVRRFAKAAEIAKVEKQDPGK